MKVYKQPTKSYFVLAFDRFNFRFGYTRPWHIGINRYRGITMDMFAIWIFGIFLQIDTDKCDSYEEIRKNALVVERFRRLLEEERRLLEEEK